VNPIEQQVLNVLASGSDEYGYFSFAGIKARGGLELDVKQIRRACRSLKRKGLADFCSGLWDDDGRPAGSGYGATRAGREAAEPIEVPYYGE